MILDAARRRAVDQTQIGTLRPGEEGMPRVIITIAA